VQQQSISAYLKDRAYPNIDAVDANLLDHLKPSALAPGGYYNMKCPACGEMSGFYYPNGAYVGCHRANNCGVGTSIWDAVAVAGYQNKEILERICNAAGIDLPSNDNNGRDSGPATVSPGKAIYMVTQELAKENAKHLRTLQQDRGLTDEQMSLMRLGYYTTPRDVLKRLEAFGITRETAISLGYIEVDKDDSTKLTTGLSNRVVGYWPNPDKNIRLWGRLPQGKGDKFNPKYRFAFSMDKEIPYLFGQRKPTILCAIEGVFDAWSLLFMGYWAMSYGGAHITSAQAAYLATQNVNELVVVIDADKAGYDGAVTSIRNCEPLGIVVHVVALGAGMDDPDAMRKAGRADELKALIESRISSGQYLAQLAAAYLYTKTPNERAIRRIQDVAQLLTPISRAVWEDYRRSLAIPTYTEADAARMLANLMQAGLSHQEASRRVHSRTGFELTMEAKANG